MAGRRAKNLDFLKKFITWPYLLFAMEREGEKE
jgi:hypothetical protein